MIELNTEKSIGRVLFIVEGSRTEFVILRKIFCDILKYEYVETSRNIFERQEQDYMDGKGFRLFSMLTLAFLQLGIITYSE